MNPYMGFLGKPEAKRPLGKPRRRFEDDIIITDNKLTPAIVVKLRCSYFRPYGVELEDEC
jgi:hypothetical protein